MARLEWPGDYAGEVQRVFGGVELNIGLHDGIIEEKHRRAMGDSIWLYMWCAKRQTRANGFILNGAPISYSKIQQETGYAIRTMKRWMQKLKSKGYLEVSHLNFKSMRIRICKPKKFGFKQMPLPMEEVAKSSQVTGASNGTRTGATSGPYRGPHLAPTGATSGPSKQSGSMSYIESNTKEMAVVAAPSFSLPEIIPLQSWKAFADMRREMKRPITAAAADLLIRKLLEFGASGHDLGAVLDQSVMRGWMGLFPIPDERRNGNAAFKNKAEQRTERNATALTRVLGGSQAGAASDLTYPRDRLGRGNGHRLFGGAVRHPS